MAPLGLDDVGRLVSDAMHCERDATHALAQLVPEKTGGNPFFVIQFLTALAEEGLLRLDPDAASWIWDLTQIRAKGYTDNVVDPHAVEAKAIARSDERRATATRLSRKRG